MYYYIYDTFLNDKKYEKVIDRIKTRLLDFEIQGKHEQLTLLKNIDELIGDEVKKGANTVIVVGDDQTFLKVIDVVADNDVSLGIIPVGPNNRIAEAFGVPMEEAACEIIAARKIVKLDLGLANQKYFFTDLKISKNLDRLQVEKDRFQVVPKKTCQEVEIINFYMPDPKIGFEKKLKKISAQDGYLDMVVRAKNNNHKWLKKNKMAGKIDTVMTSDKFKVKSFEYLPLELDGYKIIKTPAEIQIKRDKLKVIAGKNRRKDIK
ncbi:MAG TPA: diacylglycerol kinase family protein [Patescibacteria group bacterium]|nr:diacylglycerol kinase family protein [Patescibacteria group bacterium]